MSKYFERNKDNPKLEYQDSVDYIFKRLKTYGIFKGSKVTLDNLWRIFSEDEYYASFVVPDRETIARFVDWLDSYEEDI